MTSPGVGRLNETRLHAALKERYAEPGDRFETVVDGFVIDIVRGNRLIEIQTRGFAGMRRKLDRLLDAHPVRIVHPIPETKWIVKLASAGTPGSRRRSPKSGSVHDLFAELVSFPWLIDHPNLTIEVVMTAEEEVRRFDGRSWRRKGWSVVDRTLLDVTGGYVVEGPSDLLALLPDTLRQPFTTEELATAIARPRRLAQRMAYCLRECALLEIAGKQGNALEYRVGR